MMMGISSLAYCCGVEEVGEFCESADFHADDLPRSGTGFFVATFIDSPQCKEAYDELCKEHILLFQSKPRFNYANHVFVCVFQHRDSPDYKQYPRRGK